MELYIQYKFPAQHSENILIGFYYKGIDSTFGSTFDQMPTNTFTDLQTSDETFANMSTDVFDQIPRAVTAREEKRLIKFQERLLQDEKATEQEENRVRIKTKLKKLLVLF